MYYIKEGSGRQYKIDLKYKLTGQQLDNIIFLVKNEWNIVKKIPKWIPKDYYTTTGVHLLIENLSILDKLNIFLFIINLILWISLILK